MNIELPDFSLVVFIGASGCGKSTFAARHFLPTEVLSSDRFRALVSDDETSQDATKDAFDALHHLAAIRLRRRKLVVGAAANVPGGARTRRAGAGRRAVARAAPTPVGEGPRKPLLELARRFHAVPVALAIDVPERVC